MSFWKRLLGGGVSPRRLRAAIEANDLEQLSRLLQRLQQDGDGDRAPRDLLLAACAQGQRAGCVRLLLDAGWRNALEERDALGRTGLHLTVEQGDAESAALLLEAGADPNARDRDGVTPMNLCKSYHGTAEIAELLKAAGADPLLVDKHGKNYLM